MVRQEKEGAYTFTSEPRAVSGARKKPKFREAAPEAGYGMGPANIMFDKRVVRGNTYAAQILPAALPAEGEMGRSAKNATQPRYKAPGTPEPIEGRRHTEVQTDVYLEELTDTVPESDVFTQTDAFMDRPPTPLFIPMKIGVDAETQIEAGDLFSFDFEVEPILEVLVGKTLEQGLMEVMEEEELAAMRAHQEHFEQIRNAELVATQRMEAAEKRKIEEKERRLAQERERVAREKQVREKVAAQTFARGYLSGLVGNVFDKLYETGFFYDPVQKEVEGEFLPWLTDSVVENISQASVARATMEKLVEAALEQQAASKKAAEALRQKEIEEAEAAAAAAAAAEEAAKVLAKELAVANAKFVLYEQDPPLITEEQVAAAVAALTPEPEAPAEGEEAAAPAEPAAEAAEGEEAAAPAEPAAAPEAPPPPESDAVLAKIIEDGIITQEQVEELLAAKVAAEAAALAAEAAPAEEPAAEAAPAPAE